MQSTHTQYPQSQFRHDIIQFLNAPPQIDDHGLSAFNALKEKIRVNYNQLHELSQQWRLEAGLYEDLNAKKDIQNAPAEMRHSIPIPERMRNHEHYDALNDLVESRRNCWDLWGLNNDRFVEGQFVMDPPAQLAMPIRSQDQNLEERYDAFTQIYNIAHNLKGNSEALYVMGQEMENLFQDHNSIQDADCYANGSFASEHFWPNALL